MISPEDILKTETFDGTIVPSYFAINLRKGGRPDLGLCTLWTKAEALDRLVDPQVFGLRGPLYSLRGVEYIVRDVLINPSIRTIVVAGANANDSQEGLLSLVKNGVGNKNEIIGLNKDGKPFVFIDQGIPREAIDLFRENITIVDLTGEKDWQKVNQVISETKIQNPFNEKRLYFNETLPVGEIRKSEKIGIRIERKTIADAWVDLLFHIRQFGEVKPTDKQRNIQELASLHVVIDEDPEGILGRIPPWLPTDRKGIERYLPSMLSATPPQGSEVAYSYGAQLKNYPGGIDQIKYLSDLVKGEWYTKRAVATTWHLPNHLLDQVASAPCLVDLMFLVQDDKLLMTAHFRSHDMYRAWLENIYGLRLLQQEISSSTGIPVGKLEITSNSAHLWQEVIADADRMIDQQYPRLRDQWLEDPRGNFLIATEGGRIIVTHVDLAGNPTGNKFEGESGYKLANLITRKEFISRPDHAAYLTWQLIQAELSLTENKEYVQDRA